MLRAAGLGFSAWGLWLGFSSLGIGVGGFGFRARIQRVALRV